MVIKTAENAKEFVINMFCNEKTLHKKNCCQDLKYYDFDTYAEAKECGIDSTDCEFCKDLAIEKRKI